MSKFVRVCKDHINEGVSKLGVDYCNLQRVILRVGSMKCFYCGRDFDYVLSDIGNDRE